MAANPFDYLNAINITKEDITTDEYGERGYNPYMANRGLSYFRDSVFQANEMNRYHFLDKRLQFSFLLNSVSARKRFSKWFKPEKLGDLEVVKEYYGYSDQKAKDILDLLPPEHIEYIKQRLFRGGAT
jgi:Bacteriophage clamp loader A subunit